MILSIMLFFILKTMKIYLKKFYKKIVHFEIILCILINLKNEIKRELILKKKSFVKNELIK